MTNKPTSMRSIKTKWFNKVDFNALKDQAIEIAKTTHKDPKYILAIPTMKNGKVSYIHCCHKCGHKWTKNSRSGYCPECHNSKTSARDTNMYLLEKRFFRIAEKEDAIIIAMVSSNYSYESNDDLSFKECTFQNATVNFCIGIKDLEVCFQSSSYDNPETYSFKNPYNKALLNNLSYFYNGWEELEYTGDNFHYPEEWGYEKVSDYLKAIHSKLEFERLNKLYAPKPRNNIEVEDKPIPTPEDVDKFLTERNYHILSDKLLNADFCFGAYLQEWLYTCSCGYNHLTSQRLNKCPNDSTEYGRKTKLSNEFTFFKVELDSEKNFVWRQFVYCVNFNSEQNKFVKKVLELSRLTLLPTKKWQVVTHNITDKYWKKGSVSKILSLFSNTSSEKIPTIMVSKEVEEFYDQSILKYSGCKEYWSEHPGTAWNPNLSCYLSNWLKKPFIEQIYKVGLTKIFDFSLYRDIAYSDGIDPNGTTIYEILKINKPVFRIAKEMDLSYEELQAVKNLWAVDQTINIDLIRAFQSLPEYDVSYVSGLQRATEIIKQWSIRFKDVIEYLRNVYDYQCITPDECISIWSDYLNICHLMKLHLSHSRKFPSSLKKEHDKMTFAYRAVKDQIDKERFKDVTEANRYLEKSPDSEDFFIKIPSTPEEVVDEGSQQSHCVASYVNRIKDEKSIIAFLRKKADPDHSYYTLEITPNLSLLQCKGKGNCCLKDQLAIKFLKKWATMHKISINTRDIIF